jgi:hypothetical protein
MSMGYDANYADVIKTETLATIVGDKALVDDFVQKYEKYEPDNDGMDYLDLNDTLNNGKLGKDDSEELAALYKAWKALDTAFKKATGLALFVDYHSSADEGDSYDEVDGMFISVCGLYQPTAKYKKLKAKFGDDVVERKFYVSFG